MFRRNAFDEASQTIDRMALKVRWTLRRLAERARAAAPSVHAASCDSCEADTPWFASRAGLVGWARGRGWAIDLRGSLCPSCRRSGDGADDA